MKTYKTAEIAQRYGIHPNTVRLYEALALLPKPEREPNGYRVFTDFHMEQIKLIRTALQVEVLQNGLRKTVIDILRTSATGDFDGALRRTERYVEQIAREQRNAEEAIAIAEQLLSGHGQEKENVFFSRQEAADHLQISIDTLRNWELNGLLTVKRRRNGYRVYTSEDLRRLKIIRSLRCANYSLAAILRMLCALSGDPQADIRRVIDTPEEDADIISVCDKLLTSLQCVQANAQDMIIHLGDMKKKIKLNPTL